MQRTDFGAEQRIKSCLSRQSKEIAIFEFLDRRYYTH